MGLEYILTVRSLKYMTIELETERGESQMNGSRKKNQFTFRNLESAQESFSSQLLGRVRTDNTLDQACQRFEEQFKYNLFIAGLLEDVHCTR